MGVLELHRTRSRDYREQLVRSFLYAGIATVACLLLAYPLVYWIAFRAGPWRNLFLLFIVAPFFVTYLVRTLAWLNILADQGPVVGFLRDLHVLGAGRAAPRDSTFAVVSGITYNFFPFMALPIYVSLEQIDPRLLEAAKDLYASSTQAFLRVTLPLSAPGIVAGTLLTFIPAAGDFINAALLGTPKQTMIGNVIQAKFLESLDYPTAASLSFILMATDPRRAARLRAHRRHGEAHRMTTAAETLPRARASGRSAARTWAFVKRHALTVYALLVVAYLMLPIAVVILFSFNAPKGRFNYVWQGFTLDNWINWDGRARDPGRGRDVARDRRSSRRSSPPRSAR